MKKYIYPIIFLMLTSTVFTELLTTNVHITQFLNPVTFFLFAVVGYGLPVLLIRELYVQWGYSLVSLFIMGVGYGIWNEGIIAKTLLLNSNVPIEILNGYVSLFGINLAWSVVILTFHALLAVTIPILLTQAIFKEKFYEKWINGTNFMSISLFLAIAGTTIYFANEVTDLGAIGTPAQFVMFVLSICILFLLAKLVSNKIPVIDVNNSKKAKAKPFIMGVVFLFLFFIIQGALANMGLPAIYFFVGEALLLLVSYLALKKFDYTDLRSLVSFGIGIYFMQVIFSMRIGLIDPEVLITLLGISLALIVFWRRVNFLNKK